MSPSEGKLASYQVPKAATLAVGTEVTDGQIIDRNSAWISNQLVKVGVSVIEHRVVADDRDAITRALNELSARVDLLFVTGGLGPTSDDFTRDLLSSVYGLPLEFHEESWKEIHEKLGARGITVRDIQKQQCYYPRGAKVLNNPAGTANAFSFTSNINSKSLKVYAMPGPPTEIASVWETNLVEEMASLVPANEREELHIIRCLGRGESDVAEIVEGAIQGSGLKVGYRAHMPYVEVKLWYKQGERAKSWPVIEKTERALGASIVNRNDQDVADRWIDTVALGKALRLTDNASGGWLNERLTAKLRERKLLETPLPLTIETSFSAQPQASVTLGLETWIRVDLDEAKGMWTLRLKTGEGEETVLEERPPYNYKLRSERGRKYITEKVLALVSQRL